MTASAECSVPRYRYVGSLFTTARHTILRDNVSYIPRVCFKALTWILRVASIYVLTKLYANTFVANLVSRAFFDPSRRDRVRSTEDTEDTEPGIDHRRTTAIELSTYISNVPGWTAAEAVSSLGSSTDTANRDGLDREKRVLVEDEQVSRAYLHHPPR